MKTDTLLIGQRVSYHKGMPWQVLIFQEPPTSDDVQYKTCYTAERAMANQTSDVEIWTVRAWNLSLDELVRLVLAAGYVQL